MEVGPGSIFNILVNILLLCHSNRITVITDLH